jgi:sugar phosphate isomerase/epimerase
VFINPAGSSFGSVLVFQHYVIETVMVSSLDRRSFLKTASTAALGLSLGGCASTATETAASGTGSSAGAGPAAGEPLYKISLAEWSLNRALFGGELDPLDFAPTARKEFGIEAVEYVNQFFMDQAQNNGYLRRMKTRAADAGVDSLLIMIDKEGALGAPTEQGRIETVENHKKWVEAAAFLGCHSIRVNARSEGSPSEQKRRAADGLRRLCEFSEANGGLGVLVENHGGLSSDGEWLASVIERVDHPLAGTLPDFGNFCIEWEGNNWKSGCAREYDRYKGVRELMPYAEAVSAKSKGFDDDGTAAQTDFERMMQIVLNHDYHGYVGIEYEGDGLSEYEGIRATKRLLKRVRRTLRDA